MDNPFTQEDLQNLLALSVKAQITGQEATTVALLQQKISSLIVPKTNKEEDKKPK